MAMGVCLGLAFGAGHAWLMPKGKLQASAALGAGCQRYFLVPVEWICGPGVYYVNPDGSRVKIGQTKDMRPMPRARPTTRR